MSTNPLPIRPQPPPARAPRRVARLRAMHDPAPAGIERVAVVHHTAVVPHHHVADLPLVMPREKILRGVLPQHIEQRFRLGHFHPEYVSIAPPSEI